VYVAPGGQQLRVLKSGTGYRLEVSPEPKDSLYKPSVNELFGSVARVCGRKALGIVLTGMGDDGLIGARAMHAAGSVILGQSYESCVVYGMPKAVSEAGLVEAELTPAEIGRQLASSMTQRRLAS
jgi:two-component system, chemotaxis family, protein-glutamate methylesterase/glutaminase